MDATIENKKRVPLKENKIFRWIIIPLCITLCFVVKFFPNEIFPLFPIEIITAKGPEIVGIYKDGLNVIFIFIGCLIMWLTIGIDWPSLVCIFALGFLDSFGGFKEVFKSSFGNDTFVFLLFTFIVTYALSKTSLIKRISIAFVNNKVAKKHGFLFVTLFLLSVLVLGLFISPSVLFVAVLPILNEILDVAGINKDDLVGKIMMLGLGFTVSISSGMTTIAHVFPVLAMSGAKVEVSPIQYMAIGMPVGLILFAIMIVIFGFVLKFDKGCEKFNKVDVSSIREKIEPVTLKDWLTLAIFGVVVILWVLPSIFKEIPATKEIYNVINAYGTAMPPLLGTIALCVIRVKGKPLVNIVDAFKNGIPWSGMLMCASTLVLGAVLTSDKIGLKIWLENSMSNSIGSLPIIVLLIIFTLWAAIQTNVSSNMVTATLVATVCSGVLSGAPTAVVASMACVIGMLASFAFATPPSMPHIAIVAGSEYCNTKDVLLYGGALMFASIVVSWLGYLIGTAIL